MDREAKKFKLSQEIVSMDEKLRKDAKLNVKTVVGGRVSMFIGTQERGVMHQGRIQVVGKKQHQCSFVNQAFSNQAAKDSVSNAELNSRVRNPGVLKRRMTALSYPTKGGDRRLIEVYDPYDKSFVDWIRENPRPAFEEEQGLLNPWWRTQIRNMLDTIEYCHKKGVVHGSLRDASSYVVVDDNIHLIKMAKDASVGSINQLIGQDILEFREFLHQHVDWNYSSWDWTYFDRLFRNNRASVAQLKKHPILMDGVERLGYFQDISDALTLYDKGVPNNVRAVVGFELENSKPARFRDWHTKITLAEMLTLYNTKQYNTRSILQLLRFIRNLTRHFDLMPELHVPPGENRLVLERVISHMYPGLLSYVHNTLVQSNITGSITSE